MMVLLVLTLLLLGLSYALSRATDILVVGIKQLSKGTSFEAYGLTTFLVALATSLPELFVGLTSALENEATLPLGVVIGSNLANISLVIGGAAVLSGVVKARNQVYKKDILYAFLVALLPLLMLMDKKLSRIDGGVLLLVYLFFVVSTMNRKKKARLERVGEEYYEEEEDWGHKVLRVLGKREIEHGMFKLVVGSAALIVLSDLIVKLAGSMAELIGIPVILVGLFMVSIGTSLPEITFEIRTIRKREYMMAFGNIIGSTVANSALILGAVALISPVMLGDEAMTYLVSVIFYILIFAMFWWFTYSQRKLSRQEGLVLVGAYFSFVVVQMMIVN